MDFEITEDQEELRAAVRSVLETVCPPSIAREIVESVKAPEPPGKSARALGWSDREIFDSVIQAVSNRAFNLALKTFKVETQDAFA